MHVVVTRPEHDSAELKSRIENHGCQVSLAPLLTIVNQPIAAETLDGCGGIIATSRNGLRALAQSPALARARGIPVFTVGQATSALAASLHFRDIREGNGTAASLVPIIAAANVDGPILHLAGDHLAFDLAGALTAQGRKIRSIAAYRSVAATALPPSVIDAIKAGQVDAVVLMSPRSATTWAALMQPHRDTPGLTRVTHICLSPAVERALQTPGQVKTLTARKPTLDEIVALVYRLAAEAKTG